MMSRSLPTNLRDSNLVSWQFSSSVEILLGGHTRVEVVGVGIGVGVRVALVGVEPGRVARQVLGSVGAVTGRVGRVELVVVVSGVDTFDAALVGALAGRQSSVVLETPTSVHTQGWAARVSGRRRTLHADLVARSVAVGGRARAVMMGATAAAAPVKPGWTVGVGMMPNKKARKRRKRHARGAGDRGGRKRANCWR